MILLTVIATVLAILLGVYLMRKRTGRKIYFIGPHSSGKTLSIMTLLGQRCKTVSTLGDHSAMVGKTEIIELVQNDLTRDFVQKFHINGLDQFVFFVKNDDEVDYFPDLSGFDVKLVKWMKSENKPRKDLIYLDEDPLKLKKLLKIE